MKQNNKKETTLDKLAGMVARGFKSIEQKMATKEEMNQRFNQVDQRFNQVDQRLDDLERKIDKVDFRVDQVHELVDQGEKDFLHLQKRVQDLEKINRVHS